MRFRDIPQFISDGSYRCDVNFEHLIKWVDEMIEEGNLQLNPDFQRGHVWTEKQQVKFIEFILQGGQSGRDIYFNHPQWHGRWTNEGYHEFVCVDGLQRITAIRRFLNDEITVFDDMKYSSFEGQTDLVRHNMVIHVNDLKTRREVLCWYVQMNAGGTPHSVEEIQRVTDMMLAYKV